MKNVTITLDEATASWARVEAAREGKSLSRYVAGLLNERRRREAVQSEEPSEQRKALERFLAAPEFPGVSADLPTREELYAERLFHRHERPPVHQGSESAGPPRTRPRVARRTR